MKTHVLTNFSDWRDADLDTDARTIISAMQDNPYFPTLTGLVADLAAVAAAYTEALVAAGLGNGQAHSHKQDKRKALVKALRILGFNINMIADGNRTMLESTGFPLAREGAPGNRKIKAPIELEAGTGQVILSFQRIGDAAVHLVEYTEAPVTADSRWTRRHTPFTVMVVSRLKSGCKYAFRISGIVDDSEPVFTEPVTSRYVE